VGHIDRGVQGVVVVAVLLGAGGDRSASGADSERSLTFSRETRASSREVPRVAAPRLHLVWIDVLGLAPYAFEDAARETSAILADAGVTAVWRRGDASTVTTGDELKVVLMAGVANGARLPEHVMGGTHGGAPSHTTWIYLSNVIWALGLHDNGPLRLSLQEEAQVARAVGRVVAHETVHAVAPEVAHHSGGLMAEKLGRAFLIQARAFLSPAEHQALRAGAEAFAAAAEPALTPVARAATSVLEPDTARTKND
jgi:hypothetical protein